MSNKKLNNLYNYTDIIQLKYKDFNKKIIKADKINNKFGLIIFYSPNCQHCKESVYFWSEMSKTFKNKFNIFSYNIYNYNNLRIKEYLTISAVPLVMIINKKGKLSKFKEEINYDNVFYYICNKIKY